jgi:hypothetical protein
MLLQLEPPAPAPAPAPAGSPGRVTGFTLPEEKVVSGREGGDDFARSFTPPAAW